MKSARFSELTLLTLATALIGASGCRGGKAGAGIADAGNEDGADDGADDGMDDGSGDGSGGSDGSGDDGDGGPFNVQLLQCPEPGMLPFTTESTGWTNPDAQAVAEANPRYKDEASDILGVPGGVAIHTRAPQDSSPGTGDFVFEGTKARSPIDVGLESNALAGEWVSLWDWNGAEWVQVARDMTSGGGAYTFTGLDAPGDNYQPIYSILESDGSCTEHFVFLLDENTPVIVTDIDGTMTLSDEELFKQISDGAYDPQENMSAATLMNTWADKGYVIVYLTARPHAFRAETRAWLGEHDFPVGPIITANQLVFDDSARQYKRAWINRVSGDFKWRIAAAYGNAESDIDAYEDGAIPKDITFIVGEFAGAGDTQPIENNDYTNHIADFVDGQPDAADL